MMRGTILLASVALLLAVAAAQQRGLPITSLPGYTGRSLPKMSSGYLTVNQGLGKALFYWLVESTRSNAPLVFWVSEGVSEPRAGACRTDVHARSGRGLP